MRFSNHMAAILASALLMLGGCAVFGSGDDKDKWPASRFYEEGMSALKVGDYKTAVEHFEDLEARYPFGPYAQQAQLQIAYAYYKYDEPESAIAAADHFIKLNPRHPNVDYAYYLKGLARFPEEGSLEKWFSLDIADQDPRAPTESFQYFSELIKRYPASRYAEDAAQRMVYLRNMLARYEIQAADYYMRRGAYLAAAKRATYVIEHYPQTPSVIDALTVLTQAYNKLGLDDLARDTRRVLEMNRREPMSGESPGKIPVAN